ncbi:hypothetical protein MXD81_57745 [Microbacteriaceae bacterium K1510]|nr:hypothetical protein [Microbacteriaceae bacterium K1510]
MTEQSRIFTKSILGQSCRRFAYTLLTYFVCLMAVGVAVYIGLSTLLCILAPSNRCPILSDGIAIARRLLIPTFVAGFLVALAGHFCHRLVWWHGLFLLPLAFVLVEVLSNGIGLARLNLLAEMPVFLLVWAVMAMGNQLAWFVANSTCVVGSRPAK